MKRAALRRLASDDGVFDERQLRVGRPRERDTPGVAEDRQPVGMATKTLQDLERVDTRPLVLLTLLEPREGQGCRQERCAYGLSVR